MKDPLKQFKKDAEQIRLGTDAKRNIFASLQETMTAHPLPQRSFFLTHRYALASLAITVVGISTSYAAEFSNPGDIFYPVKIHINERVLEASALSPEAKTDVKVTLVERRVKEIKTIIEDKSADEKEIHFIEEKIDEYTNEVSTLIQESEGHDKENTKLAVARLGEALEKHQETLISVTPESPVIATIMIQDNEENINDSEQHNNNQSEDDEEARTEKELQEEINETLYAISVDIQQARVNLENLINEEGGEDGTNDKPEEDIDGQENQNKEDTEEKDIETNLEPKIDISL